MMAPSLEADWKRGGVTKQAATMAAVFGGGVLVSFGYVKGVSWFLERGEAKEEGPPVLPPTSYQWDTEDEVYPWEREEEEELTECVSS